MTILYILKKKKKKKKNKNKIRHLLISPTRLQFPTKLKPLLISNVREMSYVWRAVDNHWLDLSFFFFLCSLLFSSRSSSLLWQSQRSKLFNLMLTEYIQYVFCDKYSSYLVLHTDSLTQSDNILLWTHIHTERTHTGGEKEKYISVIESYDWLSLCTFEISKRDSITQTSDCDWLGSNQVCQIRLKSNKHIMIVTNVKSKSTKRSVF